MLNKLKLTSTAKGYHKYPDKILRMGLDANTQFIFIYMCSLPEKHNPSIVEMCSKSLLTRNTVRKCLMNLESRGIITKYKQGKGRGDKSLYAFEPAKKWNL